MTDGTEGFPTRDEAKLLFLKNPPERAELALVFGHWDPRVSASRTRHAAKLFHEGFVGRLLLSGGGKGRESEAKMMARVATELGIPTSALFLETRSQNTFQNAAYSVHLLEEAGILGSVSTVLLVSCPWHMRRVYLVSRQAFPGSVRLLSCPHAESCTEETWEATDEYREAVRFEYRLLRRFIEGGLLRL